MARRVSCPQMIGRAEPLRDIEAAMTQAAASDPRILLVAGEAGVGKTRLAREFAERAGTVGERVLWGECVPLQAGELPYAPLVAALRDGGLPPELTEGRAVGAAETEHAPARIFELLLGALGRLAGETPIALIIEDVHWADAATQDFLRFLARNLREERLLVLLTLRTDEPAIMPSLRRVLGELGTSDRAERVDLARLTAEDTALQVQGIVGDRADDALAAWVHGRADGNAYFAEELLAASSADDNSELPDSLREILLARMAGLTAPSRRVLQVIATAGRDIGHDLLPRAAGLGDEALASALHALVAAQILTCDRSAERYAFRHALAREAVYGEVLPHERRALHSAVAGALAATTPEDQRDAGEWAALAQHYEAGHEAGAGLRASIAAATAASAMYAYRAACGHLDRACSCWAEVPDHERPEGVDEVDLLWRLADAWRLAGDRDHAIPIAERALTLADADVDSRRAAGLHALLGVLNRSQREALVELEQALALLPPEPTAERAAVLAMICFKARYGRPPSYTRDAGLEALKVARSAGARAEEGLAHEMVGFALVYGGDPDAGIRHLRDAIEIAREVDHGDALAVAINSLGDGLMMLGRVEEAVAAMEADFEAVRAAGLALSEGLLLETNLAECELRLGLWPEAEDRLKRLASQSAPDEDMRLRLVAPRISLLARRGELAAASALADEARELLSGNVGPATIVFANLCRVELALLADKPAAAREIVQETRRTIGSGDLLCWPALLTLGIRAEADLAERARTQGRLKDVQAARDVAREMLGTPDLPGSLRSYRFEDPVDEPAPPETQLHWALGEAELSRLNGIPRGELWAEIASRWDRLRHPYQAAYARLREAEARLHAGDDRTIAAVALRAAHDTLKRLDEQPLREAAEALGRRARITLADPDHGLQPKRPFDLTERELTVLKHLSAGQTNRHIAEDLYLSPRTVDVHVRHILEKLHAANRVEAATIAHRHGLGASS